MKTKILTFLLFSCLFQGVASASSFESDAKEAIFQSFIQETLFQQDIVEMEQEIEKLEKEQDLILEEVGKLLMYYQENGRFFWIDILIGADSFSDLMNRFYLIEAMTEYQTNMFNRIEEKKTEISALKTIIAYKKEYLTLVQKEQLTQLQANGLSEEELRQAFASLSQEEIQGLIHEHTKAWQNEGKKEFNFFYKQFIKTVNNIPSSFVEDRIKKESLFSASATISKKDINKILHESEDFKDLTFSLQNNQLILSGHVGKTYIFAIGHFKKKNVHELKFIFDDFLLNGLSIPDEELEKFSDSSKFTFMPSKFKKGVKISDYSIDEKKLKFYFSF